MVPVLIYCAAGSDRFTKIAMDYGFRAGARLPWTMHYPVYFADQDWKKPDRKRYMYALMEHHPIMATVLDWENREQLLEVLDWADEVSKYVDKIVIIPKVIGGVRLIPKLIRNKEVFLGYSVPTKYGGTQVPIKEFGDRPVHLLGGSPHTQMKLANIMNVVSCDGNMASKLASIRCAYWVPGTAIHAHDKYWPTLEEADGWKMGEGAPYEAFRRSCNNIRSAWHNWDEETSE